MRSRRAPRVTLHRLPPIRRAISRWGTPARNRRRMLQRLRSYPWYRAPKPQDEYERELWRNRVGLLDAVFYERR